VAPTAPSLEDTFMALIEAEDRKASIGERKTDGRS
jgi:hypothetical protein